VSRNFMQPPRRNTDPDADEDSQTAGNSSAPS
jgi:hypothetical protein